MRIVDAQDSFFFEVIPSCAGSIVDAWDLSEGTIEFNDSSDGNAPEECSLIGNYPNPFNAGTRIAFNLPEAGDVSLKVYNLAGQLVEVLVDGYMDSGGHIVYWDASALSSGVYLYRYNVGDEAFTRRMTLIK